MEKFDVLSGEVKNFSELAYCILRDYPSSREGDQSLVDKFLFLYSTNPNYFLAKLRESGLLMKTLNSLTRASRRVKQRLPHLRGNNRDKILEYESMHRKIYSDQFQLGLRNKKGVVEW